jgi:modification methylase
MKTSHQVFFESAAQMAPVAPGSVDLIVTSPPYPMIEIWDDMFLCHNPAIMDALDKGDGILAFEWMHQLLDPVWEESFRVLKPGGIACINVGDATRTLNGNFILYPNHARIISKMLSIGFTPLPEILWRKQTNAPNKFMGSGMMPPGAYVTLEHEYILILRKGSKREFKKEEEKQNRMESSYFWEERNSWFSDVWMDIKGTSQKIKNGEIRLRSAAFPFEIPYRLINMYSAKDDVVLDPFLGTGTTMAAAIASARNCIGFEIEKGFIDTIGNLINTIIPQANKRIEDRLASHVDFISNRFKEKGPFKHKNRFYGFPVVTKQETALLLNNITSAKKISEAQFQISYDTSPQKAYCQDWGGCISTSLLKAKPLGRPKKSDKAPKPVQKKLLE